MRHMTSSIIAALVLLTSFGAAPAFANGTETGNRFSVSLENAPAFVAPGSSLDGVLTVTTFGPPTRRVTVRVDMLVTTPLGDAPIQSATFNMRTGRSRSFPFSLPVEDDAEPGLYQMKIIVTIEGESISVGHDFEVGK